MVSRGRRESKEKSQQVNAIEIVNPNAAGIDVGSEKHYVAIGPEKSDKPVRSFGCYTPDLEEMARWLKDNGVTTVAMESTGVYWVPVCQVLEGYNLEVKLVDARHVKNVPGRKTDVSDCQWIQQLHRHGLLRGCFLPQAEIEVIRQYWRQRCMLVESASREILHMQKAFEQMNLHVHKVLSDITGVSGMKITRAILSGERNPKVLAAMREKGVKRSEKEIVKALTGNYREEQLFALSQSVQLYDTFHAMIRDCDEKLEQCLKRFESKVPEQDLPPTSGSGHRRKNEPDFQLERELHRISGVDLTAIDGISSITAQTIVSEVGFDLSDFPSEKHFSSWLCLCPNNRITGGKVKRSRTLKNSNRVATALRLAAQSLHRSDSAMGAFFRRMKARLGAPKAITATARKLACLIYRMLRYGMEYIDIGQQQYQQRYRQQQINSLRKRADALGYVLIEAQTGVVS